MGSAERQAHHQNADGGDGGAHHHHGQHASDHLDIRQRRDQRLLDEMQEAREIDRG